MPANCFTRGMALRSTTLKKTDMPLPEPEENENKSAFMNRCMSDERIQSEFESYAQQYAVCKAQWLQGDDDDEPTNEEEDADDAD